MRQRSPIAPQNPSKPTDEHLHPVLQSVLASLDVQLEEELSRYRRQRTGQAPLPPRGLHRKAPRKNLDLIAVGATGGRTQPAAPAVSPSPLPAEPSIEPVSGVGETETQPPHLFPDEPGGELVRVTGDLPPVLEPPDDYLESSEELLRSLTEEEVEATPPDRSLMESLLTPLGMGSLLMLLMASAMFGYVAMNPASLNGLGRLFARREAAPTNAASPGLGAPAPGSGADLPNSPPLDGQEFPDLSLNNPTVLRSQRPGMSGATTRTSPQMTPPTATAPASSRPTTVRPAPPLANTGSAPVRVAPVAPSQPTAPAPVRSAPQRSTATVARPAAPAPQPAPAQPAPTADSRPVAAEPGAYPVKLVVPYDGDRTLERVKEVVPDAFVRNSADGAHIQVGAFGSKAEAEARLQELQQRGITPQVQQP